MKIKDVIKITKGTALICTDSEKKTINFLSSIEYGNLTASDYIYIPLIENNENVLMKLKSI